MIDPDAEKIIEMTLTKGKTCFVLESDFINLSKFKWSLDGKGYAVRGTSSGGVKRQFKMHREIMGLKAGDPREVDHKDGDALNNVRSNLRICDHSQNLKNKKISSSNKTGYKGVSVCKQTGMFKAQIRVKGKNKNLGRFINAEKAHEAYKKSAIENYGEFARFI